MTVRTLECLELLQVRDTPGVSLSGCGVGYFVGSEREVRRKRSELN